MPAAQLELVALLDATLPFWACLRLMTLLAVSDECGNPLATFSEHFFNWVRWEAIALALPRLVTQLELVAPLAATIPVWASLCLITFLTVCHERGNPLECLFECFLAPLAAALAIAFSDRQTFS